MNKIFTTLLLAVLLMPAVPVQASDTQVELRLQLLAIMDYIEALTPGATLNEAELREVINDGAMWTLNAQAADGSFNYEYWPFEDDYSRDNNMVRQAGTLFMLSEVYLHRAEKDVAEAAAIEQAINYFESITVASRHEDDDFLCILFQENGSRCYLGATALALIGILNYVTAEPQKVTEYQDLIDGYAAYLMAAKFDDRGFSKTYDIEDGFTNAESPFFNGETMLALVKLYQHEADEIIKTFLEDSFAYMSQQEYESGLYLWIMAALKEMQLLWPNDAYLTYAEAFTDARLLSAGTRRNITHNYCAPLEGMVSAYSLLEDSVGETKRRQLLNEINFWLSKSTSLQLHEQNPYRLILVEGVPQLRKAPQPHLAHGGFLTGESELAERIDFTQHCVSAYLQKLVDIDGKAL